jgi:hypothetical protein
MEILFYLDALVFCSFWLYLHASVATHSSCLALVQRIRSFVSHWRRIRVLFVIAKLEPLLRRFIQLSRGKRCSYFFLISLFVILYFFWFLELAHVFRTPIFWIVGIVEFFMLVCELFAIVRLKTLFNYAKGVPLDTTIGIYRIPAQIRHDVDHTISFQLALDVLLILICS